MQNRYWLFVLIVLYVNVYASYDAIIPGVQYKNIIRTDPAQSIHILLVDPQVVDIKIGIANNKCASAQKTTDIAQAHNAIAAINGSFFDFGCKNKFYDLMTQVFDCLGYSNYNAYPVYALYDDNNYYSAPSIFTGAIGWSSVNQQPAFGVIKTDITFVMNGQKYPVRELNKPYPTAPTLYNDRYDEKTPALHKRADEIVIVGDHIEKIIPASRGKTHIPKDGWVYVVPKSFKKLTASLHSGDSVSIDITNVQRMEDVSAGSAVEWRAQDHVLASTPLLVRNGQIISDLYEKKSDFYIKKHPRSAVGVLHDGHWVFLVVDGRQKWSEGFTIVQLAEYMHALGCTAALNLDGGGSSTMVIQNKLVNSPSGREYSLVRKERPVCNAIIICAK